MSKTDITIDYITSSNESAQKYTKEKRRIFFDDYFNKHFNTKEL